MLDKYARAERERKWIVPAPPDLNTAARRYAIEDRYIAGTRLRVRTMTELAAGAVRVYKLGQKVWRDLRDPMTVMHTTMYLDAAEFELLRALPAAEVVKVRHVFQVGNRRFALDVYEGRHRSLSILEVGVGAELDVSSPDFAGLEVSRDERFTGGRLASETEDEISALLTDPSRTSVSDG